MVKITETKTSGVSIDDTDEFIADIQKRVFEEWEQGKITILHQGTISDREFTVLFNTQYDNYKKDLKKLLRSAYKNVFNPLKTLEGLEYIWYKYTFIGVLSEEYVNSQRNRMYNSMVYPTTDIKEQAQKIKNKINKLLNKD